MDAQSRRRADGSEVDRYSIRQRGPEVALCATAYRAALYRAVALNICIEYLMSRCGRGCKHVYLLVLLFTEKL